MSSFAPWELSTTTAETTALTIDPSHYPLILSPTTWKEASGFQFVWEDNSAALIMIDQVAG